MARDNEHFNCSQEHEFNYVSKLYTEQIKVYNFLKASCEEGDISYSTHKEVYEMINKKFGYSIPN